MKTQTKAHQHCQERLCFQEVPEFQPAQIHSVQGKTPQNNPISKGEPQALGLSLGASLTAS